jgi:hypothetical protein
MDIADIMDILMLHNAYYKTCRIMKDEFREVHSGQAAKRDTPKSIWLVSVQRR